MFDGWTHDARLALRLLRKNPVFTVTAALSLAVGIGANTAIFSLASALLLRPLPGLADPGRLVDVGRGGNGAGFDTVSFPNYTDIRSRTTTLAGVYAYRLEPTPMSLSDAGGAERVYGAIVSGNYFSVLGVAPHLGRLLADGDDRAPGEGPVAVLSHSLWTRRFSADPTVVGRQITISGSPFVVVGIAAPGFQGTTVLEPDLWVPLSTIAQAMPSRRASLLTSRRSTWLIMGGRLKDGVSVAQADAELGAIGAALEREYPDTNRRLRFQAMPLAAVPGVTTMVGGFLGLLLAIVSLLLLVACVNLAGMLLARGAERRREVAVRLALGAGGVRIVRQLLTETLALFALGCIAGLLLSRWMNALLLALLPEFPVPLNVRLETDWRVVAFAIGTSAVAAVLCGIAPALQARRTSMLASLKNESRNGAESPLRLRRAFVVAQVTFSIVLVVTAGLFLRALQNASDMPTGFDGRDVDVVRLDLSLAGLDEQTGRRFVRDLVARASALPGVQAASVAADVPLDGGRMGFGTLRIPGAHGPAPEDGFRADWNLVEPGFFRTMGMAVIRGRDFDHSDVATAPLVAIVNEAFARSAWPGEDPLGKQFETDARSDTPEQMEKVTVVGIAADARLMSVAEPASPYVYVPVQQVYNSSVNLMVKTAGVSVIPAVRTLVREMNPHLPLTEALAFEQVAALGTIPQRIVAAVAGALGVVGLLLAGLGIYGVTAYAVSQRTREIGIRMALGADNRDVLRMLLRQGLVVALIGVTAGLGLAAIGSTFLRALLHGISGVDPLVFSGAAALFTGMALLATFVPARRALAVDPMTALRNE